MPHTNSSQQQQHFPPLTLSAYRKPEYTIRLTSAPPLLRIQSHYDLTAQSLILGHGASSIVRLATHRVTGMPVAVKCIRKYDVLSRLRKRRLEECDILKSLSACPISTTFTGNHEQAKHGNEHIIQLLDVYETDEEVQLVMEHCAGGDLFDVIRRCHRAAGPTSPSSRGRNVSDDEGEQDEQNHLTEKGQGQEKTQCMTLKSIHDRPTRTREKSNRKNHQKGIMSRSRSRTRSTSRSRSRCTMNDKEDTAQTSSLEAQAASIASQLLSALVCLHRRGIVHRDVKPENILLVSKSDDHDDSNEYNDPTMKVKLSDFGLARELHNYDVSTPNASTSHVSFDSNETAGETDSDSCELPSTRSRAYSRCGSDYYIAPEVGTQKGYDTAVDLYSLGVTLYVLLSGKHPYTSTGSSSEDDDIPLDPYNDHSIIEFPHRCWHLISDEAKHLVRQMLHPDPSSRITAMEALEHDWIVRHTMHQNKTNSNGNRRLIHKPTADPFCPSSVAIPESLPLPSNKGCPSSPMSSSRKRLVPATVLVSPSRSDVTRRRTSFGGVVVSSSNDLCPCQAVSVLRVL